MKLIITEKPSVAQDIAAIFGVTEKGVGYLYNDEIKITWAFGHLVGLASPKTYGFSAWKLEDLPMQPNPFIYEVSEDPGAIKQFNTIKHLLKEADEIICATDAGREGEAIFRYIYNACNCTKSFKRLWISSLTESSIREGFKNLKDGEEYDSLYFSAKARNEADWLIGMNATRALTLKSGSSTALSIGRVQTPTLAIICRRFLENKNSVKSKYYKVEATLVDQDTKFKTSVSKSFETYQEATAVVDMIGKEITLSKREEKDITQLPPLLYDLTSIQADANRIYKVKAQKTLDTIQTLYEKHKLVTYPRTSSRYLGTDMKDIIAEKMPSLEILKLGTQFNTALTNPIQNYCFDNSKLSDHHAIIPTFENYNKIQYLSELERSIFMLIVIQTVKSMQDKCIKRRLSYSFNIDSSHSLKCSSSIIISHGWRILDSLTKKCSENEDIEDEEFTQALPNLIEGNQAVVLEKEVLEKETKAPPLLTEATLLREMEAAGKKIEDEYIRSAIKDCGIGTPATRSNIIETLFKRGYITSEKNRLIPLELGLDIFNLVKDLPIGNATLTGDWEYKLNKIASKQFDVEDFNREIAEYNKKLTEVMKSSTLSNEKVLKINCFCGKNILENQKYYLCNSCGFKLPKLLCGKTIDEKLILSLLRDKKTEVIHGLKNKEGKSFDAAIVWSSEEKKTSFSFDSDPVGICPKCNTPVIKMGKVFKCKTENCNFVIFSECCGKLLTEKDAIDLLLKKKTRVIKGMIGKSGKKFDAAIVLTEDFKTKFEFPNNKK